MHPYIAALVTRVVRFAKCLAAEPNRPAALYKASGSNVAETLAKIANERILRGKNHKKRETLVKLAVQYLMNLDACFERVILVEGRGRKNQPPVGVLRK